MANTKTEEKSLPEFVAYILYRAETFCSEWKITSSEALLAALWVVSDPDWSYGGGDTADWDLAKVVIMGERGHDLSDTRIFEPGPVAIYRQRRQRALHQQAAEAEVPPTLTLVCRNR
jgi:hypothetical protein